MSTPKILSLAIALCKRERVHVPVMRGADLAALLEAVAMLKAEIR
ncbi:hypothetical protein [Escherichia coli]